MPCRKKTVLQALVATQLAPVRLARRGYHDAGKEQSADQQSQPGERLSVSPMVRPRTNASYWPVWWEDGMA